MIMTRRILAVFLVLALICTLIACDDESSEKTSAPTDTGIIETQTPSPTPSPEPSVTPSSSSADHYSVTQLSEDIANIVEKVKPAVVFISVEVETKDFFGRTVTKSASGSGAVVSSDGYILTNNHVVEDARNIEVSFPDRSETFEAEIIGTDTLTDLAVIKIEGGDFPTASFGDASRLRPGNLVITIGNPLGLVGGPTITLGIVSNTERSFAFGDSTYYDLIQTDAAINPGNSGGPLINVNGGIVGVNAVLESGAQNIGFAISANTAKPVYEALVAEPHRVVRPALGAGLLTVTPSLATSEELSRQSGVIITSIIADGAAEKAGLKVDDIIIRFDGKEAIEATQLVKQLWWFHKVGDKIAITYWRDGHQEDIVVELEERTW
ncbi:MAG: trypsin-like peptidase domain-containing protein [Dehalococcoidia bacterium]|nr:trypsin-like peptidase domain-containing protein [Dehalococcoidia bacterium]